MPAVSGTDLTYADLLRIPEDGRRHEILGGVHVVRPAPTPFHQLVLANLVQALQALRLGSRARVLFAPLDVRLGEHDIVEPDLVVIAAARLSIVGSTCVEGSPDLLVEVLSPSTRRRDRGDKRGLYEEAGVREYWIVDPEARVVTQLVLEQGRYRQIEFDRGEFESVAFPGLWVSVDAVFDESLGG